MTTQRATKIQIRRRRLDEDVENVYEGVRETIGELNRWMPWWAHPDYSREDARNWLESRPAAWDARTEMDFSIVDEADRFLGNCGLHRFAWPHGTAEVGYWVRSSETGRGVATAAVSRLCEFAFGELGLHRLELVIAVDNAASQRVAEKAGAHREGILRQRFLLGDGQRHDAVLYAITNDSAVAEG